MSKHDLTQGQVSASLARLTVPIMAGVSSSIVVQALEMGFVGQLSTAHVAAITFTLPLVMVITGIALGISIGKSSVIARSVGTQRLTPKAGAISDGAIKADDEVGMLGTHSMIFVAGLMVILSTLCWLAIDPLFTAIGATPELLPLIYSYLDIYLPGTVLFTATMVCRGIIRANGSANIPSAIMTIGAIINLLFDPIFIFGWFGFPAMALAGAATAMTLTRAGTLVVLLWFVVQDNMVLRKDHFRHWYRSAKRILQVGLPAVATNLIGPVTAADIVDQIAEYGATAVAGFGVANRIEAVAAMLMFALSGSIGPFVGQNWGAHRVDRVRDGIIVAFLFCLGWGLLVAAPLFLFRNSIGALIDTSREVITVAATYFALIPLSYGLWGVLMMSSASFNALGKPLPSTALSFGRMLIVYIPLATVLNDSFGYIGIFVATALSNAMFGIISGRWFARRLDIMAGQLAR